jgi:putative ATP-binding cassette transporter
MDLLHFFLSNANLPLKKLVYHSILAGGSNVLIMALLNSAAAHASDQNSEIPILLLLGITIMIFVLSQKSIWRTSTTEVESMVNNIRLKLIDKIAGCELEVLEKMGKSDIYAAINQHANTIALSGIPVIISIQSVILLGFTLIYIGYLSIPAFFLVAVFLGVAIVYAVQRGKISQRLLTNAIEKEKESYAAITDLLEGFKEVKLHESRKKDLIHYTSTLSHNAMNSRATANRTLAEN